MNFDTEKSDNSSIESSFLLWVYSKDVSSTPSIFYSSIQAEGPKVVVGSIFGIRYMN